MKYLPTFALWHADLLGLPGTVPICTASGGTVGGKSVSGITGSPWDNISASVSGTAQVRP